jgi:AAA domain
VNIRLQTNSLETAADQVLDAVFRAPIPLIIVDSPPGAGKTGLVERITALAELAFNRRVLCVTPKASQAEDLAYRLAAAHPGLVVQLLMSSSRSLAGSTSQQIIVMDSAKYLRPTGIVISTVAKPTMHLEQLQPGSFDLLICDEAYQVALNQLLPIIDLAPCVVLVRDPGQLLPFEEIDLSRYETAPGRVHLPAPIEILRRYPQTPKFLLPQTRRLPQDAVEIIQPAFYPALPFSSAVPPAARRSKFAAAGTSGSIDKALDKIAAGISMVGIVFPEQYQVLEGVDAELSRFVAEVAERALIRRAEWVGERVLTESDIGCIDPHVASGGAIRGQLRALGRNDIRVNTPEIWQGAECPITIIKHPLSGIVTPTEFDLDPGRFCVMTTRHQIGCIIISRANVPRVLAEYRHDCGKTVSGAEDRAWNGYNAHKIVWEQLAGRGNLLNR